MRIFTYGIEQRQMDAIRCIFGMAEYIDVSNQYQDILALCADVVIMSVDHTPDDILLTIKEYEQEVGDDDNTQYVYISDEEIDEWFKEYYSGAMHYLESR